MRSETRIPVPLRFIAGFFSDRLCRAKLDGGQLNSSEIKLIDIVHVFHSSIHSQSLSPSEPSHMQWKLPKCSSCRKDVLVGARDLPIRPGWCCVNPKDCCSPAGQTSLDEIKDSVSYASNFVRQSQTCPKPHTAIIECLRL